MKFKYMRNLNVLLASCSVLFLAACSGGGGSSGGGNPPPAGPVAISVMDVSVEEGDSGTVELQFDLVLNAAASDDVQIDFTTVDNSANANEDYEENQSRLTIPAGNTTASIIVTVNGDNTIELDETLTLALNNPTSNATLTTTEAIGTIINDDFPFLSLSAAEVVEGDSGTTDLTFSVSLDQQAIGDVTVDFASSDITAVAGEDYTAINDTLVIAEGELTSSIAVTVFGDSNPEPDETLNLNLSNLSNNARFAGDTAAFGTIRTDELSSVSITGNSIQEGDSGSQALAFAISMSAPVLGPVTLSYETVDTGSAEAGVDFIAASGDIVIAEGDSSAVITIQINGDTIDEDNENFTVSLTAIDGNATLSAGQSEALGQIVDDDDSVSETPTLRVQNASIAEGVDGDNRIMTFTASLSASSNSETQFDYSTQAIESEAFPDVDFVTVNFATATIAAGALSTDLSVTIVGDDQIEEDEIFNLLIANPTPNVILLTPTVVGLIADDDDPSETLPRLSVRHSSLIEGNDGEANMVFTLSLTDVATSDVSVDYLAQDFSFQPEALAGSDYQSVSGTVTITQGQTEVLVSVPVIGDTVIENDERFEFSISNISGDAKLGNSNVFGTIVSDEPFTFVSVSNPGQVEGDVGDVTQLEFIVSLNVPATEDITLDYATEDRTATVADNDYVPLSSSTLTIPQGQTQASIIVEIVGDDMQETDEQFVLLLSNVSQNAEFSQSKGTGAIANDDNSVGWSFPQLLDPNDETGEDTKPGLAMNEAGEAMIVWRHYDGIGSLDNFNPTVRYSPGMGWGPVERPEGQSSISATVTMDGNNESLVLYNYSGPVTEKNTSQSGWAEIIRHADAIEAVHPELHSFYQFNVIDENEQGNSTLVGSVNGSISNISGTVVRHYVPGNGWSLPFLLAPNEMFQNPVVGVDGVGNAILFRSGGTTAWHYDISSDTWTESAPITNSIFVDEANLAVSSNGNAIAVWRETFNIVANYYDAQSGVWTGPIVLDPTGGISDRESDYPQAAITGEGHGVVIFLENADPNSGFSWKILSRSYDAQNGWAAMNEEVSNPQLQHRFFDDSNNITLINGPDVPRLAIGTSGEPIVVWSEDVDADGVHTIRSSRYETSWGPADTLSDDAMGDASLPNIQMNAVGNAIVVWQQKDPLDEIFDVWGIRYQAPN